MLALRGRGVRVQGAGSVFVKLEISGLAFELRALGSLHFCWSII